jgi:hypothetical protein
VPTVCFVATEGCFLTGEGFNKNVVVDVVISDDFFLCKKQRCLAINTHSSNNTTLSV